MKQRLIVLAAVGLVLLLTACGPATPSPEAKATDTPVAVVASPTATSLPSTATPTPVAEVTPPPVAEATEASPAPTKAFPTPNPNPECVAAPIPQDPNIPPVTADDWSKGPADAPVTLVEYGDFQ